MPLKFAYRLEAFFVVLSHSCFLTNIPSISSPSRSVKRNKNVRDRIAKLREFYEKVTDTIFIQNGDIITVF